MEEFKIFAAREAQGWSDGATVGNYIRWFGPVTDDIGGVLVDRLQPSGKQVLDLCCGQGVLTDALARAGATATGLDFSYRMLDVARARGSSAEFVQGDAATLPFEDARFDAITCNFGFSHLPDRPAALAEMARVLRPGGQLYMSFWEAPDRSPAFQLVMKALKDHGDLSRAVPSPDFFGFCDPAAAEQDLSAAGLEMTHHWVATPSWTLDAPEALFEIFETATVAMAMLLKTQDETALKAMRSQVGEQVARAFRHGTRYVVPVPVVVVEARLP